MSPPQNFDINPLLTISTPTTTVHQAIIISHLLPASKLVSPITLPTILRNTQNDVFPNTKVFDSASVLNPSLLTVLRIKSGIRLWCYMAIWNLSPANLMVLCPLPSPGLKSSSP